MTARMCQEEGKDRSPDFIIKTRRQRIPIVIQNKKIRYCLLRSSDLSSEACLHAALSFPCDPITHLLMLSPHSFAGWLLHFVNSNNKQKWESSFALQSSNHVRESSGNSGIRGKTKMSSWRILWHSKFQQSCSLNISWPITKSCFLIYMEKLHNLSLIGFCKKLWSYLRNVKNPVQNFRNVQRFLVNELALSQIRKHALNIELHPRNPRCLDGHQWLMTSMAINFSWPRWSSFADDLDGHQQKNYHFFSTLVEQCVV